MIQVGKYVNRYFFTIKKSTQINFSVKQEKNMQINFSSPIVIVEFFLHTYESETQ